jgi:hypothetical protein
MVLVKLVPVVGGEWDHELFCLGETKLDRPKPSAPLKSIDASAFEELQKRVTELQDQIHDMRSQEQALESLNIVLRHQATMLRAALRRAQTFVEGVRSDWGLADREKVLKQSRREAEVIEAILAAALAEKEHK